MSEVAYIYRVEVGNLVSPPARTQEYVFPRYVAMYIAKLYGYHYTALREAFRCSSVYGGPLAISHRIRIDAALRTRIADIMRFLEYQVMQDDDEALS